MLAVLGSVSGDHARRGARRGAKWLTDKDKRLSPLPSPQTQPDLRSESASYRYLRAAQLFINFQKQENAPTNHPRVKFVAGKPT